MINNELDDFTCTPSLVWQKDIVKKFRQILYKRFDCLDHFAINIILANGITVNLCSNLAYIQQYKKMGMQQFSSGLFPEVYDNLPVVPWRLLLHPKDGLRLRKYVYSKEVLHELYNGCLLYRR
jgi:hypothetical protein